MNRLNDSWLNKSQRFVKAFAVIVQWLKFSAFIGKHEELRNISRSASSMEGSSRKGSLFHNSCICFLEFDITRNEVMVKVIFERYFVSLHSCVRDSFRSRSSRRGEILNKITILGIFVFRRLASYFWSRLFNSYWRSENWNNFIEYGVQYCSYLA